LGALARVLHSPSKAAKNASELVRVGVDTGEETGNEQTGSSPVKRGSRAVHRGRGSVPPKKESAYAEGDQRNQKWRGE